jgi:Ca-activated chloride channel family protein
MSAPSAPQRLDVPGLRYDAPAEPDVRQRAIVNGEPYADVYTQHYGVNPTIDTEEESTSTFAIDVDTASYSITRAYLGQGVLVPEGAVRVEEFVNAFRYEYAPPRDEAFSLHAEAFPSPTREGFHVLHLGVRGRDVSARERKPAQLAFVIDVSGSMEQGGRLELVKDALRLLVDALDRDDRIGIVVYGTSARVLLEPTPASERGRILRIIDALRAEGSTNAQAGIERGYAMLDRHFRDGHTHRVILCSDGVANNGIATSADGIFATVRDRAARGIQISTVGFGMGNYNDILMEQLAQKGDGTYRYVDRLAEARRIFVEELSGTLEVIAKDVKIQVEFDPRVVARFRLLGYENRRLSREDFDDDRVDAGEIGAGHGVTALYEVKLRGAVDALGVLRVRYAAPEGGASRLVERRLSRDVVRTELARASGPSRLSFAVASFAEKLRRSYWTRTLSYAEILGQIDALPRSLASRDDVRELRELVAAAATLDQREDRFTAEEPPGDDALDRVPVLR